MDSAPPLEAEESRPYVAGPAHHPPGGHTQAPPPAVPPSSLWLLGPVVPLREGARPSGSCSFGDPGAAGLSGGARGARCLLGVVVLGSRPRALTAGAHAQSAPAWRLGLSAVGSSLICADGTFAPPRDEGSPGIGEGPVGPETEENLTRAHNAGRSRSGPSKPFRRRGRPCVACACASECAQVCLCMFMIPAACACESRPACHRVCTCMPVQLCM